MKKIKIEAIKTWLAKVDNWLLIFDDAPDQASLEPYLLQHGHTIITSRNHIWHNVTTLSVAAMIPTETFAFLVKTTKQMDESSAQALGLALGYLPLALAQAAAYIQENGISYADAEYLTLFGEHRTDLLADEAFKAKDYPDTVATTWLVAFKPVSH